ncbi:hypothetical protein G6F22_022042 [Rhizopus arrhizus]|nr:hypothetical protein G6F22_022042 [Rhizopus arrhizus]KAG1165133.1 hypothetical protein G6F35_018953 [Rhizopus arrhizus]
MWPRRSDQRAAKRCAQAGAACSSSLKSASKPAPWRCSTRSSRAEAMRGSGAADGGRRGAPICDITPAAASCSSSFS